MVQVAVLSVLNLPRQGFPATCPVGPCCVCSHLLFASEILCDSPNLFPRALFAGFWRWGGKSQGKAPSGRGCDSPGVKSILEDPGAASRDDRIFVLKVYCKIETRSHNKLSTRTFLIVPTSCPWVFKDE